jgi:hypothetical protein
VFAISTKPKSASRRCPTSKITRASRQATH